MKPRNESKTIQYIVYAILLVAVIFVCIHGAIAYGETLEQVESGQVRSADTVFTCLNLLFNRLTYNSEEFLFNQHSKQWIMWGCFGWLIFVMMIENSRKNYIHGKEFGTSKWGSLVDIKDLFATNILQDEIKKAKKVGNPIGRWQVKNQVVKECESIGNATLKRRLDSAKERESARKANGSSDKQLYNEEVRQIKAEIKESVELSKREAWKPYQLQDDYKATLKEIDENALLNDLEKAKRKKKAKTDFDNKLKSFYNGKTKIEGLKKKYSNADMLFTQTERVSFYNYKINQNIMIIGGSGSGKSRGYIMPNVLQAHSSYVITDPKGEILEKGGKFLSEVEGYKIKVLNLDEKRLSDGYNPFVYIHPEREGYEERVLSLIETIIVNTDGGEKKGGSDPFWDKAERLFLQAIFFFVTDGFVIEQRNMNTVMRLISMLEIGEEEDNLDSDLDYFATLFGRRFGEHHIGVEQYREFRSKASGKTAKSIVISAVARLAPFRTKEVKRIFSYDTMGLDVVGEEKTAIFVVVPPTDTSFNFIAGMLFTQLFQELQYCATQVHKHDGQRLPVPVRFLLDEFANTCTIPQFPKILAYARSFGIGITIVLQSLEQIKNMYKDEWGVLIDNCNSMLFLGSVTHMDTLEYISKLLGKGTFDKRTTGRTRGRQGSSSENFDVVGRELMFADDIRKLPKEDCLLIIGGRNPFYSKKYDYTKHPNYSYTSDSSNSNSFEYEPASPPTKEISHGEIESEEEVLVPNEDAEIKVADIPVNDDQRKELKALAEGFERLIPITDDLMDVEDGEEFDMDEYQKYLGRELESDKQEVLDIASNLVKSVLQEAESSSPTVIPLLKELKLFGRTWRDLVPLPDDYFKVEDGEEDSEEELVEMADIILAEDSEQIDLSDKLSAEDDDLIDIILNDDDVLREVEILDNM